MPCPAQSTSMPKPSSSSSSSSAAATSQGSVLQVSALGSGRPMVPRSYRPEGAVQSNGHKGATSHTSQESAPDKPRARVNLEKSDSPAPSCVSLQSMDPQGNLTGEFTPDPIVMKLERLHSPGLHSMDSEDIKVESITPAHSSELAASLLTKEDFRCSVCTGVLRDPVSIPCGHSYCRQCITSYWEQPNPSGHYACPQCPHTYSSRPALYSNSSLAQVVHKLEHFSPVLPAQSYAGPGDVECDFCTGRKLKAVKSCLTCSACFCFTHVRDHYRIPVLQRHTLVDAVENMETKSLHSELKQVSELMILG
ncbi:tripartite motif-containing protein 42-like isoform X2 [Engraulis encrasicolus]|uniref:tripartite motif-containing protein 42-like isoform X2 n=1 Tax=Engraulis encrasicolus TaxID=184585 RepID=UPI002FD3A86F